MTTTNESGNCLEYTLIASQLLRALSLFVLFPPSASPGRVLICYWGSWSHYRPGEGRFSVDNVDPHLCTHLVYAFAKLENGVIAPFDPWLDLQTGGRHGKVTNRNISSVCYSSNVCLLQRPPYISVALFAALFLCPQPWYKGMPRYGRWWSYAVRVRVREHFFTPQENTSTSRKLTKPQEKKAGTLCSQRGRKRDVSYRDKRCSLCVSNSLSLHFPLAPYQQYGLPRFFLGLESIPNRLRTSPRAHTSREPTRSSMRTPNTHARTQGYHVQKHGLVNHYDCVRKAHRMKVYTTNLLRHYLYIQREPQRR